MIDFTDCDIDTFTMYGGSDQKRSIIYKGARYMLKLPDRIDASERISLNSSYSNSVFSEKVSCDILEALGFSVQHIELGYIRNDSDVVRPVVACCNFVPTGASLVSFKAVANSILSSKMGKLPKLSEIYAVFSRTSAYFDADACNAALASYWDLFILDAFLGNSNRHGDDWGYLCLAGSRHVIPSPIYDCGSCLYSQIADTAMEAVLSNSDEIIKRVDTFPTVALLLPDGKKVNYRQYISSLANEDCNSALRRVYPRIDMQTVQRVINDNPDLTEIRKRFYCTMLNARYDRILKYSYEKLLSTDNKTNLFS